ncbi:probable sodium/metabolite cotransporter BASS4, chloroplastic, partial [Tanacetum coccineum]
VAFALTNPNLGCLAHRYEISKFNLIGIFLISGLTLRNEEIGEAAETWPMNYFVFGYGVVSHGSGSGSGSYINPESLVIEQYTARSGMDSKMAKTCYHSHVAFALTNPNLGCLAHRYEISKFNLIGIFLISGLTLRNEEIGEAAETWPMNYFVFGYGVVSHGSGSGSGSYINPESLPEWHGLEDGLKLLSSHVAFALTNPNLGCLAHRYEISKFNLIGIFLISGLTLRNEEIGEAAEAWPMNYLVFGYGLCIFEHTLCHMALALALAHISIRKVWPSLPETLLVTEPRMALSAQPSDGLALSLTVFHHELIWYLPFVTVLVSEFVIEPETAMVTEPETAIVTEPETGTVTGVETAIVTEAETVIVTEAETAIVTESETVPETVLVTEPVNVFVIVTETGSLAPGLRFENPVVQFQEPPVWT